MSEEASRTAGWPEDMAQIFRLDGQRAVVTGAASGLGEAIALGFARFGADVACLDIDLEGAQETAGKISEIGRQSTADGLDVRDWQSVRSAAEEAGRGPGRWTLPSTSPASTSANPCSSWNPRSSPGCST